MLTQPTENTDYLSQANYWDAKAAAAERQVRNVKDPLAMDSWLMIADTCRQLAGQFRDMADEQKPAPHKFLARFRAGKH